MKQQLQSVIAELQRWRDQGLTLPIWWRDDDAVAPTPALDRLLVLAGDFGAPLHLAVIPRLAEDALRERLQEAERVFVLSHGWQQQNYAPPNEKSAEFGAHRPIHVMLEEARRGWRRIEEIFGPQAQPVFVPPWNRVCPAVVDGLADCGLGAISTFKPRATKYPAPNLLQVNTHFDPIAWRGGGGLDVPAILTARLVARLIARRQGRSDNSEPYGLLTHHLLHDEPVWSFTASLVEVLVESGVTRWASPLDGC
jgi:hypothetical protein